MQKWSPEPSASRSELESALTFETAFEVRKPAILLVEDDDIISKLLTHILSQRGFNVHLAKDGREAFESLDQIATPNLVLLDIILPFFDGFDVLSKIREKDDWTNVPVIMLTSKTQESNIVRAFDGGADDYITKPFQIEELMIRVRRFLRK